MRTSMIIGIGLVVAIAVGLGGSRVIESACAQQPQKSTAKTLSDSGLLMAHAVTDGGVQQLTVVDPRYRVVGVYHVDAISGAIQLKSVRNIRWDLMMEQFNGVAPLPQEIRTLIDRK